MDGKGSVIFFAALVLVFACLAFCCLLDVPQGEDSAQAIAYPVRQAVLAANDSSAAPGLYKGKESPETHVPVALLTKTAPPVPRIECDQNGVPLIHANYIRANYVKFPPEAFYG